MCVAGETPVGVDSSSILDYSSRFPARRKEKELYNEFPNGGGGGSASN